MKKYKILFMLLILFSSITYGNYYSYNDAPYFIRQHNLRKQKDVDFHNQRRYNYFLERERHRKYRRYYNRNYNGSYKNYSRYYNKDYKKLQNYKYNYYIDKWERRDKKFNSQENKSWRDTYQRNMGINKKVARKNQLSRKIIYHRSK